MQKTGEFVKKSEDLVAAFERMPLGVAWKTTCDAVQEAIEELKGKARAEIFPDAIEPAGADLLADLQAQTDTLIRENYAAGLAELHRCSLETHPALAKALRGRVAMSRLKEMVGVDSVVTQRPEVEIVSEAVEKFELEVSKQLLEKGELLPWSEILGEKIPVLIGRVAAVVDRRKKHATEELERQEKKRKEADEVLRKEGEAKQEKLDHDVEATKNALKRKERLALHERAGHLADRIEKLKLKNDRIELESGRPYSVRDVVAHLRQDMFSAGKVEMIERQVDRLRDERRQSELRL